MISRIGKWVFALVESLIGLILIALFISFIASQRSELEQLSVVIANSRRVYLGLGIIVTLAFFITQGQAYRLSLQAVHKDIPLGTSVTLYLKRFFLGSFLPAGATVSQYTYVKDLKRFNIAELEAHLASTLYILIGAVAYICFLVPTNLYLLWSHQLTESEGYGSMIILVGTILLIGEFLLLFRQRGATYRLARRLMPDLPTFLESWKNKSIDRKPLVWLFIYSLLVNALGVVTLWVTFLAFNQSSSPILAVVGFTIMILVITISPIFQGIGLVEVSLVYVLKQFGLNYHSSVAVTLLFRFFQLWVPFLLGMIIVLVEKIKRNPVVRNNLRIP